MWSEVYGNKHHFLPLHYYLADATVVESAHGSGAEHGRQMRRHLVCKQNIEQVLSLLTKYEQFLDL